MVCSTMSRGPENLGVKRTASSGMRTLLYRTENTGMDIASHNVTFAYFTHIGQIR